MHQSRVIPESPPDGRRAFVVDSLEQLRHASLSNAKKILFKTPLVTISTQKQSATAKQLAPSSLEPHHHRARFIQEKERVDYISIRDEKYSSGFTSKSTFKDFERCEKTLGILHASRPLCVDNTPWSLTDKQTPLVNDFNFGGDNDEETKKRARCQSSSHAHDIERNYEDLKKRPVSRSRATSRGKHSGIQTNEPNFVKMNLTHKSWRPKKRQGGNNRKCTRVFDENNNENNNHTSETRNHDLEKRPSNNALPNDIIGDCLDVMEERKTKELSGNTTQVVYRNQDLCTKKIPICYHGFPCVEKAVKKSGFGNKGRKFYGCSLGSNKKSFDGTGGDGCGFFAWVNNTKEAGLTSFTAEQGDSAEEEIVSQQRAIWSKFSIPEIKDHLKDFGYSVSGNKSELLDRMEVAYRDRLRIGRDFRLLNSNADPNNNNNANEDRLRECLRTVFHCEEFYPAQLWAIKRVMEKKPTLCVLPTGSGKSLIYQIPAFLSSGVALIISPLISLMQDQVRNLPPGVCGAIISSNQTSTEIGETMRKLREKRLHLLFISPERLISDSFQRLLRNKQSMPDISFVCIDEAHCISSWSHNFRPSYLQVGSVLARLNPVPCILALTATATSLVVTDICDRLGIERENGCEIRDWYRANLHVGIREVEHEDSRFTLLLEILKQQQKDLGCSIIYTGTKYEADMLAERINAEFRQKIALSYHAGLPSALRTKIQDQFMRNKIPIVVGTVAFGMGINKRDIRLVIHYRVPRSIEDYVQEIGRAGRDNLDAQCILFLSCADVRRNLALSYSDCVDSHNFVNLFNHMCRMVMEQDKLGDSVCFRDEHGTPSFAVCISVEEFTKKYDIKEEVLETLLVYLSLHPFSILSFLPVGYMSARVTLMGSRSHMLNNSQKQIESEPLVAHIHQFGGKFDDGTCIPKYDVKILDVANRMQRNPQWVISEFSRLRDLGKIHVELREPALFFTVAKDPRANMMCKWKEQHQEIVSLLLETHMRVEKSIESKVRKLYRMLKLGQMLSLEHHDNMGQFYAGISAYFAGENDLAAEGDLQAHDQSHPQYDIPFCHLSESVVRLLEDDIKSILKDDSAKGRRSTVRSVARVLHGISSPAFPQEQMKALSQWGKMERYDIKDVFQQVEMCFLRNRVPVARASQ